MRRVAFLGMVVLALAVGRPAHAASGSIAALQVGLRAHGFYVGTIDGVPGPLTKAAVLRLQATHGIRATGRVGKPTRRALGALGAPLLGQRPLWPGLVGWDVSALEFRLVAYGLSPAAVDGRFDAATATALRRFQLAHAADAGRHRRDEDLQRAGPQRRAATEAEARGRRPPRSLG